MQKVQGWIVEHHSGLIGNEKIYITKDAYKIVSEPLNFTIVMKAPDWNVTFKVITVQCRVIQLPDRKKLPMRMFFINDNRNRKDELTTQRVTKTSFAPDTFKLPTGYKSAAGEKQVLLMDPMRQSFLEDLEGEK